jgi:peptide/nickel transport system ATP-binding protein
MTASPRPPGSGAGAALSVRDLGVTAVGTATPLLSGVSFDIPAGSTVGLVGPSGAGKSTLALSLMRLLRHGTALDAASEIRVGDTALHTLGAREMRAIRGRRIAMVFQEPLLALDPAMPIGEQVAEAAIVHGIAPDEARDRARAMLERVGFAAAGRAATLYPHELSGGMRQRALIAAAMMLGPDLLVADEPTTALDPTIQAQVLDLLARLREESGTTLLLISHDLDVVGERCERVIALEQGRVVQDAPAAEVLRSRRPAAQLRAPGAVRPTPPGPPLLEVRSLQVRFPGAGALGRAGAVHAVEELSFTLAKGEALGVVGESGCGKTSAALAILRLIEPSAGQVRLDGAELDAFGRRALRRLRKRMQLVPQDAGASLTPHLTAEALVAEGLEVHGLAQGSEALRRARVLLDEVGLPSRVAGARPGALSSGERQRVAIARALAPEPDLLICDEPVASVDDATRERILTLLEHRRDTGGLALLFISHDLAAVARIASRVLVMYLGRIVESGTTAGVLGTPRMPYTQALLAAVPTGEPARLARRTVLTGEAAGSGERPRGCAFHPRCPHPRKDDQCRGERPRLVPVGVGAEEHLAACGKLHPVPGA